MTSDSEDEEICNITSRTASSLQQKWSKFLLPYVNKYVALTIKFPIKSGKDKERYYNHIHLIFLKENIGIKSFDPYRPAWEYLKESPKFISMTAATNAAPRVVSSTVTDDDNFESHVVSAGDMPTASKFSVRPIGNKKAKRMAEEEKIMSNVTAKLKSTLIPATTSTATSAALAGALHKVTHVIATGIKEWSVRQAYSNASPTLKRHYDSLLLKLRIRELESTLQKEEFGEEVQRKGGILRNEEVGEEMQHEVGILPNDEHSETCVATEATTIAGVPAPITEVEFVQGCCSL